MTDAKKKVEYIFVIFDWSCTLYANFEHLCEEWTLAGKNEKKNIKNWHEWLESFFSLSANSSWLHHGFNHSS